MNLFDLTNKTAIVTGACGLIGRQHCAALAAAGANVVVADINQAAADAVAAGLPGGPHLPLAVDVTKPDSLAAARDQIIQQFGHIDVLVNNAAINDMFENPALAADLSKFENFPLATFQQVLEVNVTGVFLAAQVFGTPMAAQGSGSIINVASTYGIVGPDQSIYRNAAGEQTFYKSPSYPMTKGAVVNFTRYLAAYWGNKGVRGEHPLAGRRGEQPGRLFRAAVQRQNAPGPHGRRHRLPRRRGVPGLRSLGIHDRRQPGGGRRLDGHLS